MADPGEKPKHKPSQKHTLDEVLRSLQDMVRHELAGLPPRHTTDARHASRTESQDIHNDLEKAIETLKSDLEGSLLRTGGSIPFESLDNPLPGLRTSSGAASPPDLPPYAPHKELPGLHSDHAPPDAARARSATALKDHRELPFLDSVVPTGATEPTPLRYDVPSPSRPGLNDMPARRETANGPIATTRRTSEARRASDSARGPRLDPIADTDRKPASDDPLVSATLSDAEAIAREEALLAGSIPVLTDAVVFPNAAGDIDADAPAQLEVPLPSPDRARDMAIQVAARLNIEMRKSGRRGLNTAAIIRLAQLLRDALAQAQPNVDNSGRDPDR